MSTLAAVALLLVAWSGIGCQGEVVLVNEGHGVQVTNDLSEDVRVTYLEDGRLKADG